MSTRQAVIGIECHVQLDTKTKLFCACPIVHGEQANSAICSVCTGQPGALPAINGQAVALGIRAGLALGCQINLRSVFARKNYFYPDLPKGYQISQFEAPLCSGGAVHAELDGQTWCFELTRIHLEEDAGKLLHDGPDSRVDWNRAGTPLAEIVSEPVMHSAAEAVAYMRMLHRCMVTAGVCKGDMEKGHMRFDVNISVHEPNTPWGTRVEIKNLNSFRFAAKAIDGEIARQIGILDAGGSVRQHTRGWTGHGTAPLRDKEEASDYRYFPDPDLPPLLLDADELEAQRKCLPGTPLDTHLLEINAAEAARWEQQYKLGTKRSKMLRSDARTADFFEASVACGGKAHDMAAWVQTEFLRCLKGCENDWALVALQPRHLVELQALIDDGELSHTAAKKVFDVLFREGGDAQSLVDSLQLRQVTDTSALEGVVQRVLAAHPNECASFREGNHKVMGFLMGQIMREMAGAANPQRVRELLNIALKDPS